MDRCAQYPETTDNEREFEIGTAHYKIGDAKARQTTAGRQSLSAPVVEFEKGVGDQNASLRPYHGWRPNGIPIEPNIVPILGPPE